SDARRNGKLGARRDVLASVPRKDRRSVGVSRLDDEPLRSGIHAVSGGGAGREEKRKSQEGPSRSQFNRRLRVSSPSMQEKKRLRANPLAVPLHIVLVEPEIPPNTGNIARLSAAAVCPLHLVGPLGFRIDDHAVKRAGLDYWHLVEVRRHLDF